MSLHSLFCSRLWNGGIDPVREYPSFARIRGYNELWCMHGNLNVRSKCAPWYSYFRARLALTKVNIVNSTIVVAHSGALSNNFRFKWGHDIIEQWPVNELAPNQAPTHILVADRNMGTYEFLFINFPEWSSCKIARTLGESRPRYINVFTYMLMNSLMFISYNYNDFTWPLW